MKLQAEAKEMFVQLSGDPRFMRWLAAEKHATQDFLMRAGEMVQVFRSQARLQLLLDMEAATVK